MTFKNVSNFLVTSQNFNCIKKNCCPVHVPNIHVVRREQLKKRQITIKGYKSAPGASTAAEAFLYTSFETYEIPLLFVS